MSKFVVVELSSVGVLVHHDGLDTQFTEILGYSRFGVSRNHLDGLGSYV